MVTAIDSIGGCDFIYIHIYLYICISEGLRCVIYVKKGMDHAILVRQKGCNNGGYNLTRKILTIVIFVLILYGGLLKDKFGK